MAVNVFELPKLSVIYIFRIEDENHKDCLKIGETSLQSETDDIFSLQPNAHVLNEAAKDRINEYTRTAAIPWRLLHTETGFCQKEKKITSFSDKDVHRVLLRSNIKRKEFPSGGKEWFCCNLETAKAAIRAVKEGRGALPSLKETADAVLPIVFRPEQQDAIKKTVKRFEGGNSRMLWNAKMRFGKTLCALQTVKELQYGRTLILTHRPVVNDGWYEDFNKIFADSPEYAYASKDKGESIERLEREYNQGKRKYVYFASLQDLRGSEEVEGKFCKNHCIFSVGWDLVIIDEAHEGTQTKLGQAVLKALVKDHTKQLHLSGTPFNLLDDFEEDGIYTWDYTMEQRAKKEWDDTHFGDPNPYADLPKLHILTYNLGILAKEFARFADEELAFNFREFFRTNAKGSFVHNGAVKSFLNLLVRPDAENCYPFASEKFREIFRHTLWVLPGVKEAAALEGLLKGHEVFGNGAFKIVNVAGDGGTSGDNDEAEKTENALESVRKAIGEHPEETRTITLTCGRLTTGVSVPAWTGVFMLAGSYNTKASAYMQTIFRVQTPAVINGRRKEDCYVFDFAPDRTLQVLAAVPKVSRKAGKTTEAQKEALEGFLEFCPVIAIAGGKMEEINVTRMLQELKKVYIERVVRNGFEDACLYNDKLLQLKGIDLEKFQNLKRIIGETKAMPGTGQIDVNTQGLTGKDQKEKEDIEKKPKKKRTPEEEKRLAELREKAKNRKTAISILRGISIRMPLLIYGAEIENEREGLTLEKFVSLVDPASWGEFMPHGVTKELFKEFIPYYDEEIFTAAAKRIRAMTRAADTLTVEERIARIAEIFGNFRNPDKETVLTPWRVVNLHMGETLGGYCFFDEEYAQEMDKPRFIEHAGITEEVFNPESRLLEINSKSGLYPLYLAYSVYRSRLSQCTRKPTTQEEHLALWDKTLAENLYVVCKTPMAKAITRRTLAGFRNAEVRMWAPEDLINQIKNKQTNFIEKIRDPKHFNTMKINAVVGNPPYQEIIAQKITENGQKRSSSVFHYFQLISEKLGRFTSLIYPGGRWIHRSGKGMETFGLNQINDRSMVLLEYFPDSTDIFPEVGIADGLSIVLKDREKKSGGFCYKYVRHGECKSENIENPGEELLTLNPMDHSIVQKLNAVMSLPQFGCLHDSVLSRKLFSIESDYVEKNPSAVREYEEGGVFDPKTEIKLFTNDKAGKSGRARWYVAKRDIITTGLPYLNRWKVIVSSANAGGQKRDNQISIVDNYSAFGRSRVALKTFDTEKEADNFKKYATSELIRFSLLLSNEDLKTLAKKTPDLINYANDNGVIDYKDNVDEQLYEFFKIDEDEKRYIHSTLQNIRQRKNQI